MKRIFCFGNEWLDQDNEAVLLAKDLPKWNIEHCKDPSQLLPILEGGEEVIVLDVAQGIKTPTIIKNLNQLESAKPVTSHDLDLGYLLKLHEAMGVIKEDQVTFLLIPQGVPVDSGGIERMLDKIDMFL